MDLKVALLESNPSKFIAACLELKASNSSGNGAAAASEMQNLEEIKELLSKCTTTLSSQISEKSKAAVLSDAKKVGEPLLIINDIQLFEPRGRFKLTISSSSLFLEGKNFSTLIATDNISHLACVPSSTSSKKEGKRKTHNT